LYVYRCTIGSSPPCSCRIPLSLTWAGRTVQITAYWFQYESEPERNSNVYEVAQKAVTDNFPGT